MMLENVCVARMSFSDEADARDYVHSCERAFAEQVDCVADEILALRECKLLGLGGPSCAGKSTTAKHLIRHLEAEGKHVHIISIDDFFREQPKENLAQQPDGKPASVDFDSIDALDFPLFCQCLDQLMHGDEAQIPIYDLSRGRRSGTRTYHIRDNNDIFLFEGIQTVYPAISSLLEQYPYFSMFIRVARPLQAGKLTLEPNQIRLLRRLVRDYYRRASEPEFTLFLWKGVRENEERSIFPYAAQCNAQLDSTMGYELGMLRPYLENILPSILTSDDYGNIAKAILHDIKEIPQLSCELLPEIALYREFVGKQQ